MSFYTRAIVALLFFTTILVGNVSCVGSESTTSFSDILGTWDDVPSTPANSAWELSWGTGEVVLHVSFAVHEPDSSVVFIIPDHGVFEATEVRQTGHERFILSLESARGETIQDLALRFVDQNAIVISVHEDPIPNFYPFDTDSSKEARYC